MATVPTPIVPRLQSHSARLVSPTSMMAFSVCRQIVNSDIMRS